MSLRWTYNTAKSDRENRWDAFLTALNSFTSDNGHKYKNFPGMDHDEVYNELVVLSFPNFNEWIDSGKWEAEKAERDLPNLTWANLGFKCVLMSWGNLCYRFKKAMTEKKATSYMSDRIPGADRTLTYSDTVESSRKALYLSDYERPHDGHGRIDTYSDAWDYIESCEEFGKPVDKFKLGEILISIGRAPDGDEMPEYAGIVKLMKAAKIRAKSCCTTTWEQIFRDMLRNPPQKISFMSRSGLRDGYCSSRYTTEYLVPGTEDNPRYTARKEAG